MRNTTAAIISLLTLLHTVMYSQLVPGYQGRKNIIAYRDNISVSAMEPTYNNITLSGEGKTDESIFIPFNNTHSISYERIIGRHFALEANYSLAASTVYSSINGNLYDAPTNTYLQYEVDDIRTTVFGNYITGSLKFYSSNAFAPVGLYFKATLGYCLMRGKFNLEKDVVVEVVQTNGINSSYSLGTEEGYFESGAVTAGISVGHQRVFANRLVFNRGMSLNLLFNDDASSFNTDAYVQMHKRLRRHDIFTFYLGLGFLF